MDIFETLLLMADINMIPERDRGNHITLVFGFIREFEVQMKLQIPLEIKEIADKFYFIPDNAVKDFLSDAFHRYHKSDKTNEDANDFMSIWSKMGLIHLNDSSLKDFKRDTDTYLQTVTDAIYTDNTNICDEFMKFLEDKYLEDYGPRNPMDRDLRNTFLAFDKDGDGVINFQDLKQTLLELGEIVTDHDIADMIDQADFGGDGVLDFQEFKHLMLYEDIGRSNNGI